LGGERVGTGALFQRKDRVIATSFE